MQQVQKQCKDWRHIRAHDMSGAGTNWEKVHVGDYPGKATGRSSSGGCRASNTQETPTCGCPAQDTDHERDYNHTGHTNGNSHLKFFAD